MLLVRSLLSHPLWVSRPHVQRPVVAQNCVAERGWSLLEMLAVLVLIVLTGKLLLPNWAQGLAKTQLRQQQQALLLQLRQARASAQTHHQPVTVCGWSSAAGCSANLSSATLQLISFMDANQDGQWQAEEHLLHRQTLHRRVKIAFNRGAYVRFTPLGTSGQPGTWSLCWQQVSAGQGIVLSSSGNLRRKQVVCDAWD